jgi:integral membrane sensor domain MASE1
MQDALGPIRWMPYFGQVGLIAAVYFAAAKASLLLAIPPGYATAVWPPSGIALAAIRTRQLHGRILAPRRSRYRHR